MEFMSEENSFEDVRKAGKQLVAKRNDFIQETRYSLDLLQNKVLLYMFSKVKPEDTPDTLYEFRFSELFAVMRYKTDSYTEVKKLIQKMNGLSFWRDAENDDEDDELITFFDSDSVTANKKGYFKVRFSKKLFPYILDLERQRVEDNQPYTSYQLQNVILMKHFYSQRLYEILKTYQFNNMKWKFEIGTGSEHDLQRRLAAVDPESREAVIPEGWKNWYIFNRDVLKPAEKDINQFTDIKIKYEPSKIDFQGKKHRGYVSITFAMVSKTANELEETDRFIDSAYKELESEAEDRKYHQTTLDEFINTQTELQKQEEEIIKQEEELEKMDEELKKEDELEKRVEKTLHPVFTSCYGNDFSDEQLDHLYSFCCQKIEPGRIRFEDRDMWATDYLGHYKQMIDATPDDTKTTTYKRLLNYVRNDYDMFAYVVTEQYEKKKVEPNQRLIKLSMSKSVKEEISTKEGPESIMDEKRNSRMKAYIDALSNAQEADK